MSMPVSGPGKFSERTDRQPIRTPTGLPYGEAGALTDLQRQAPLAASAPPAAPTVVPLTAGTQAPGQPVTAGAAIGPGPGEEVLGPQSPGPPATGGAISQAIARAAATDTSGMLQQLLIAAQQRGL